MKKDVLYKRTLLPYITVAKNKIWEKPWFWSWLLHWMKPPLLDTCHNLKPLTLGLGFLPPANFKRANLCCSDFLHSHMSYCSYSYYALACYSYSSWNFVHEHLAFLDNFHFGVLLTTPNVQASISLLITSGNTFVSFPWSCSGHYCVCCLHPFVFTFVPLMRIWNFVSPLCTKTLVNLKDDFEVCEGRCDLPTSLPFVALSFDYNL